MRSGEEMIFTQGNVQGTYVRLDTSTNEGTWDGLPRESGRVTDLRSSPISGKADEHGEGQQVFFDAHEREVCKMQSAETILGIVHERGKRGLPLTNIYRLLYNPDLYLKAYGKIYRNKGAMTPGTTKETVDGMALSKIEAIIEVPSI